MSTTKASFNVPRQLIPGEAISGGEEIGGGSIAKTPVGLGHNWLDKNVVNDMINNFNQKEAQMKRNQLVKTAQPMKVRESVKLRKNIGSVANDQDVMERKERTISVTGNKLD